MICESCQSEIPDAVELCPQCGRAVRKETTKSCPSCGRKYPDKANFCKIDGTKLVGCLITAGEAIHVHANDTSGAEWITATDVSRSRLGSEQDNRENKSRDQGRISNGFDEQALKQGSAVTFPPCDGLECANLYAQDIFAAPSSQPRRKKHLSFSVEVEHMSEVRSTAEQMSMFVAQPKQGDNGIVCRDAGRRTVPMQSTVRMTLIRFVI